MADQTEQIVKRLIEEGAKAAAYLRGLQPADWEQAVYTTGGRWRVREVLCHFVSAEHAIVRFGSDILRGGPGAPEDFVLDEFNETQVGGMADREPGGLIAEFEQGRAATVAMAQTMTEADLERIGRHPWFGRAPLGNMLKLAYRHTMIHLRDVKRALETGQPVPHMDVTPPSAA